MPSHQRPAIAVRRQAGLTVIYLRGHIGAHLGPTLAQTLITELTRRRLKLLTIHLHTTTSLHPNTRAMLIAAERVARGQGKGFGVVRGGFTTGSIQELADPPDA